jgi:hypothetical protein
LIQSNGFFGLFRGIGTVLTGAAPAHALYFAAYEFSKKRISSVETGVHQPLQTAAAGATATVCLFVYIRLFFVCLFVCWCVFVGSFVRSFIYVCFVLGFVCNRNDVLFHRSRKNLMNDKTLF